MNDDKGMTFNAAIGWGILFLVLVGATDIPGTAKPAGMLAWLFFVAVLFKYGPDAFKTVTTVNTVKVETFTPDPMVTPQTGVLR